MDRDALLTLVRLLRLAPPPAKGLLPKVLLNLAAHAPTRDALLRLLFANLRAAMEANEGGAGDCGALYGRDVHVVCSKPDAAARLLSPSLEDGASAAPPPLVRCRFARLHSPPLSVPAPLAGARASSSSKKNPERCTEGLEGRC